MSLLPDINAEFRQSRNPADIKSILGAGDEGFTDGIKNLGPTIHRIINAPNLQAAGDEAEYLDYYFLPATILTPNTKPIAEVSGYLTDILTSPDSTTPTPYSKHLAAGIADALTHQISLPMRRKYASSAEATGSSLNDSIVTNNYIQARLLMRFDTVDNDSAFKSAWKASKDYRDETGSHFKDLNLAQPDVLIKTLTEANPLLETFSSLLFIGLEAYRTPDFNKWERHTVLELTEGVTANPKFHHLFRDGQFDHIAPYYRTLLWSFLPMASDLKSGVNEDPVVESAAQYFLTHPDISSNFWTLFARIDNKGWTPPGTRSATMSSSSELVEWALLQDPSTCRSFLNTLDLNAAGRTDADRRRIINNLWATTGALKVIHPDAPNLGLFIETAEAESASHTPGRYELTAQVLRDQTAGIVYKDIKGNTLAASPKEGQNPTELYDQLKSRGTQPLFVSNINSGWTVPATPDTETQEAPETTTPVLAEFSLKGVGNLVETTPESANNVLRTLSRKIDYSLTHFIELENMTKLPKPNPEDTQVLFPGALPPSHALSALDSAGIIAIARKGPEVNVIVNPARAGVEVDTEKRNLSLRGEVIGHDLIKEKGQSEIADTRTLVMEGTLNRFAYFKLHQLVEAALGYLANPNEANGFSQSNISEARRIVKQWKTIARTNNLPPTLSFLDNPLKRGPDSAHALIRANGQDGFLKIE